MFFYEIEGHMYAKIELNWTSKNLWPKKSLRLLKSMQMPLQIHLSSPKPPLLDFNIKKIE